MKRLTGIAAAFLLFVPVVSSHAQQAPADDGFLGEIEYAVQLRSPAELRALDELTLIDDPR